MSSVINAQTDVAKSQAFWDTSRLQRLKLNSQDPQALKAAAQEFSSLMLQMMIKSMRDAQKSLKSDLYASEACQQYEAMLDQQWALHLARSEKNSIVDTVLQQFTKNMQQSEPKDTKITNSMLAKQQQNWVELKASAPLPKPDNTKSLPISLNKTLGATTWQPVFEPKPARETTIPVATTSFQNFTGREDFIDKLLPAAVTAAKTIGVDPKLLLAQAALETGWGEKIAKLPNGESSYNLFGIKASHDWHGKKVAIKTTEYTDGILQRKTDWFRAYTHFAESMNDYAKLIGNSARYQAPKANSQTPARYAQALQDAGFATDPNYANKILAIYQGL